MRKFLDYLAWFVLLGIFLWLVLKVAGVLNTPILIEYSPIFGAVYLAGWGMSKLSTAVRDVRGIKKEIRKLDVDFAKIRENCPALR